jgi:hypothetical protein
LPIIASPSLVILLTIEATKYGRLIAHLPLDSPLCLDLLQQYVYALIALVNGLNHALLLTLDLVLGINEVRAPL